MTHLNPGEVLSSDKEESADPGAVLTRRQESSAVHPSNNFSMQNVFPPSKTSSIAPSANLYEMAVNSRNSSVTSAEDGISDYQSLAPSHQSVSAGSVGVDSGAEVFHTANSLSEALGRVPLETLGKDR